MGGRGTRAFERGRTVMIPAETQGGRQPGEQRTPVRSEARGIRGASERSEVVEPNGKRSGKPAQAAEWKQKLAAFQQAAKTTEKKSQKP